MATNEFGYALLAVVIGRYFKTMDEKLRHQLKIKKVRDMKNPTILMNEKDFEALKKEIESKTTIIVGKNPTYEGVPIKTRDFIELGNIIIYDDVMSKLL